MLQRKKLAGTALALRDRRDYHEMQTVWEGD